MNKLIAPLIVGVLALLAAAWVQKHLSPATATQAEKDFYGYGGAALGAWIAMTYIVKRIAPAA